MKKLVVLLVLVLIAGCTTTDMSLYVAADKATYEVIAPEYLDFVAKSQLTEGQKERRLNLVKTWKARIDGAEENDDDPGTE